MRASRLMSILILLQLRTRLTAETLAQEFGVSVRTIYRDIDELSAAGVPVYGDRGHGGGFRLRDGWRTRLTGLVPDEAEALQLIGLPGAAAQLGLGAAAAGVRGKLLASLPGEDATLAGRLQERLHVDPVDWYHEEEAPAHLPALLRAVLDERRIALRYRSWRGERAWRVQPLGLVLKAGRWYLVARSGARTMTLRVGAILEQQVLDEAFDREREFDLPRYWAESLRRFEAELRPGVATLRASPRGCAWLAEAGRWAAQAVAAAGPEEADGWRTLHLPVEAPEQAARLLLSIGPEIEVIEPATLREQVRSWAREVARRHR